MGGVCRAQSASLKNQTRSACLPHATRPVDLIVSSHGAVTRASYESRCVASSQHSGQGAQLKISCHRRMLAWALLHTSTAAARERGGLCSSPQGPQSIDDDPCCCDLVSLTVRFPNHRLPVPL